jgi:hypothetical protein
MTKQELIKNLQTQNCYEFLYTSYTDHTDINVALPPAIVENLKRVERTQTDEQVTAVWHFPAVNCYVRFDGKVTDVVSSCDNVYLVEPEEYTAVRFNKVKIEPFSTDRLLVDIQNCNNFQYDFDEALDDLKSNLLYITSVKSIEEYDRDDYGAKAYRIFEVTIDNGEKHIIRMDGCYSSYGGFELETVKIVKPVEKTVIVYE